MIIQVFVYVFIKFSIKTPHLTLSDITHKRFYWLPASCEFFGLLYLTPNILYLEEVNKDHYKHITDTELLEKFYYDKNNQWLGILLQRYTMMLFGVCMKYMKNEEEAKDCVQQVFLKTIAELHKYKVEYFKSWIYMVAKNHCLMKLRDSQGKIPLALNEQTLSPEDEPLSKQAYIDKDRLLDAMTIALEDLNKEQKLCVTLFYLDKKTYNEIADSTGFNIMQVKSYIQNGKRNLKIIIERTLNKK